MKASRIVFLDLKRTEADVQCRPAVTAHVSAGGSGHSQVVLEETLSKKQNEIK